MAPTPMTLSDVQGYFSCLKIFIARPREI